MPKFNRGDLVRNPRLHPDLVFRVVDYQGRTTSVVVEHGSFYDLYGRLFPVVPDRIDSFLTDRLVLDFEAMCKRAIAE